MFQDLNCVHLASDFRTEASRKRWERNIAVDNSHRLSHAEAFAQRAQSSARRQRLGSQTEVSGGVYPSAQGQPLGLAPQPDDTVLTFTVHRFDR